MVITAPKPPLAPVVKTGQLVEALPVLPPSVSPAASDMSAAASAPPVPAPAVLDPAGSVPVQEPPVAVVSPPAAAGAAVPPSLAAPVVLTPAVDVAQPAVSATTGGLGPVTAIGEAVRPAPVIPPVGQVALPIAPAPPTAAPTAAPPAQRQPSPGRRQHRPHSPVPRDERETSRRRHDSPRRRAVPPPHAHSASGAALGNRMRLPWVPPVAGMEFVTAGGGPVTAQYPSLLHMAPPPPAAALSQQTLVGPSPSAVVPEASLGQLWRLSEGLRAVHLIQVYGHAALSQGVPLDGPPRDECLDAADRLGELLAPVLAAPARGGVAGVG
ncbi:unnamed protein product [Closterium sp. Naga37s-1]|nr:unnamed protein product [Closterium sp. Naga37s-1]